MVLDLVSRYRVRTIDVGHNLPQTACRGIESC